VSLRAGNLYDKYRQGAESKLHYFYLIRSKLNPIDTTPSKAIMPYSNR